jgi:23S rRNA pseudouridine2605 synthase
VKVRGRLVRGEEEKVYLLLNKPRGVVSTARDPEGRETVLDLVRSRGARLFPVGRLDLQSEGLLLLTNDGPLAEALLHPRFEIPRTYLAKVRGRIDEEARRRLARGLVLEGCRTKPLRVREVRRLEAASWVEVRVHEGRQHLVRDALAAVGHPVVKLKRVAFGPLRLGRLPSGQSRQLRPEELEALRAATSARARRRSREAAD